MIGHLLFQGTVRFPEMTNLGSPGISVAAVTYHRDDGKNSIGVRGVFRYQLDPSAPEGPTEVFGRIAILLVSGPRHIPFAFSAGSEKIVFEDDVQRLRYDLTGVFELDVFEQSGLEAAPGEYFISALMGRYVSKVCRVTL